MAARAEVRLNDRQFTLISKAVAEPKRFEMLRKIGEAKEALSCSFLCEWTNLAPATVSHHLKELDNASLIMIARTGKFAYISIRRDVWNAYLKRLAIL